MDFVKTFGKWMHSFNNQAVMWAEPDVAGFLDKRGGTFTSWKTRFFILQGSTLFYFLNPYNIQNPLGVLPMEGSGLEAAGVEEGGPQRKWCFRIKLGAQFGLAKRSTYIFAAPSKQAQEEWLDNLKYAATTRADLISYLHKSRRVGAALRFKLSKSPANLKMMAEAKRGIEGYALQTEMVKLRAKLVYLNEQALFIRSQSEVYEGNVMRALAAWDVFAQHLLGKRMWNYIDKLQNELNLSKEINQLLETKADFMQGHNVEVLEEDVRTELRNVCEKALTKIQEHQAKVTTNKKLLALKRRAANKNQVEARSGWIISKMGSMQSLGSNIKKSAVQNLAAEFNNDMSIVTKFIDTEVPTVNKFIGKEVLAVNKLIEKGKAIKTGASTMAKDNALHLASGLRRDMTHINEFVAKEMSSVNKLLDKSKATTVAKSKTLQMDGAAIEKKGVFKEGVKGAVASLGWKALNRMKLQRLRFSQRFLPPGRSRPGSADSSRSKRGFWDRIRPQSPGASTSGTKTRPRSAGDTPKGLRKSKHQESPYHLDGWKTIGIFSQEKEVMSPGFVSHDGRASATFFYDEDKGPKPQKRPSNIHEVVAKHSNILSTVIGFRQESLNQLTQPTFPFKHSDNDDNEYIPPAKLETR